MKNEKDQEPAIEKKDNAEMDAPPPPPVAASSNAGQEPAQAVSAQTNRPDSAAASDEAVERQIRQKSRRSFLVGAAAALAGLAGWRWLITRREDDGVPWPLRRALEINEQLARDYFKDERLAPSFPRAAAKEPRVNGEEGLDEGFDPTTWKLQVVGGTDPTASSDTNEASEDQASDAASLWLTLDDIKALTRVDMTTELKCIEGWSEVVQWAGARFADFANKYQAAGSARYVSLETPGGGYYVGLDMASARHPQTLLCYEMNGQPLTLDHGAPLRLVIPVKYGIKSIKRIGTIRFTDQRPADFWAERGYDWYAGH